MKILKSLLASALVSAVLPELFAGYVPSDSEWNSWPTITDGTGELSASNYKVISSVSRGQLKIQAGKAVTIWFKGSGVNLTCTAAENCQAGIKLPSTAYLILRSADTFTHKVKAVGHNGNNAESGSKGYSGSVSKHGKGGHGGAGAGGGGAGIGGDGGSGGSGGSGGDDYATKEKEDPAEPFWGHNGGNANAGSACGTLYVHNYIEVEAIGGAGGSHADGGSHGGSDFCGGGGGGGGDAGNAPGIGTGGGGGGGGGGGAAAHPAGSGGGAHGGAVNGGTGGTNGGDDGKGGSGGNFARVEASGIVFAYSSSAVTSSAPSSPNKNCDKTQTASGASIGGGVVWLNVNLPVGQAPDSNHYDDCVVLENSIVPGFNIVVPKVSGKSFQGYYTEPTGGKQIYNSSGGRQNTTALSNGGMLYAHWTDAASGLKIDGTDISAAHAGNGWSYSDSDRTVTISSGSSHTLSGTASDVQIKVTGKSVELALNGLTLKSSRGSPLSVAGVSSTIRLNNSSSLTSLAPGKPGIDVTGGSLLIVGIYASVNAKLTVQGGSGASGIGFGQGAAASATCSLEVSQAILEAHGGGNGAYDIGIGAENAPSVKTEIIIDTSTVVADRIGGGGAGSLNRIARSSVINEKGEVPSTVSPRFIERNGTAPAYPALMPYAGKETGLAVSCYRFSKYWEKFPCHFVNGRCCLWFPNGCYRVLNEAQGFDRLVGVGNGIGASCPYAESLTVNGAAIGSGPSSGKGWNYDGSTLVLNDSAVKFQLSGVLQHPLTVQKAESVVLSEAVILATCSVSTGTPVRVEKINMIASEDSVGLRIGTGTDLKISEVSSSSSDSAALMVYSGKASAVGVDASAGLHRLTLAGGRVVAYGSLISGSDVDIGGGTSDPELELVMKGGTLEANTARVNPLTVLGGSFNVKNVYTAPAKAQFATQTAAKSMAAKTVVERPAAVAEANVAAEDYAGLFEVKAVEAVPAAQGGSGSSDAVWTLQTDLKESVKAEVQASLEDAEASLSQSLTGETPSATVQTKAGLYYGIAGASDLGALENAEPKSWTLGDGTAKTLEGEKPAADRGYFRVLVKP